MENFLAPRTGAPHTQHFSSFFVTTPLHSAHRELKFGMPH
jgi:hypothetical protein